MRQLVTLPGVRLAAIVGIGIAVLVGGGWVGLTAATGKTYHLAPLLGALAPAVATRAILGSRLGVAAGLALGAIGATLMLAAWGGIVALDIEPYATLADNIPGDVFGEVVIGALIGMFASPLLHQNQWGAHTPGDKPST